MVESKLVELVVAGSNPVGHPTLFHGLVIFGLSFALRLKLNFATLRSNATVGGAAQIRPTCRKPESTGNNLHN